jgi:hypothetical protein
MLFFVLSTGEDTFFEIPELLLEFAFFNWITPSAFFITIVVFEAFEELCPIL